MTTADDEFPALASLLGNYLHQDMDLEFDSEAEAIAEYATITSQERKRQLLDEMASFLKRYHNNLESEFTKRFQLEVHSDPGGRAVPEFFEMISTIIADPQSYIRFQTHD